MGSMRRDRTVRASGWKAALSTSVVFVAATLSGCDTISQDFDLITQSIIPPSPSEAAAMMVDHHNPDRRRQGTVWISNSPFGGAEVYVDLYRTMLEMETDPTVRAVTVRALARHGEPDDAPLIAQQLEHPNDQVRWEAAKGLQRLHNRQVVSLLLDVVRNEEELRDVRVAATHALGQYAEDRVFHVLVRALDSRELSVNRTALQSLRTLTGETHGYDPRDWLRWYNRTPAVDRFTGQQEYMYATYQRDETLFERLAFWSTTSFEPPSLPAGLRPASERRTYDDDEMPSEDEAGS